MEQPRILEEMGKVVDQSAVLSKDAFAERVSLENRQAELRRLLAEAQAKAGLGVPEDWAGQTAGSRPPDAKGFLEIHPPRLERFGRRGQLLPKRLLRRVPGTADEGCAAFLRSGAGEALIMELVTAGSPE